MDFDGRRKGELDALRRAAKELVVVTMSCPDWTWLLLFWERKGENPLPRVEFILPNMPTMQSAIGELWFPFVESGRPVNATGDHEGAVWRKSRKDSLTWMLWMTRVAQGKTRELGHQYKVETVGRWMGRCIKPSWMFYLFPCRIPTTQSRSDPFSFGKWKTLWWDLGSCSWP